ncbi:xylitol dehydrogenase [Clavulina sp. PMI_390]|nr:xylitol dehydrogenase [Clavulina sp. PMI_390]
MAGYKSNPSFVLQKINETSFEERAVPDVGPYDVLVEVKKTGLCGSDVHYLTHGGIGDFILHAPMVLGHESAGIVSHVGAKVEDLKPGMRVAMEPGRSCRRCEQCKVGKYQLCPEMVFAATPPVHGTLARYYGLPADLAYPLPEHVSLEEGAMMEPLSVGVHSVSKLGNFQTGQTIAVYGAGPVGLLCMAVARALGAARVIAVDIVQARLDFAKTYAGADTYLPPKPADGEKRIDYSKRVVKEMSEALGIDKRGAKAVDLVIDASGAEACIQMGLFLVKFGGTYVQVGMGTPEVTIPIGLFLEKELTVKGSFRYGAGDYPTAIQLVASGKVDVKPLITHRFPFKEAIKAFDTSRTGKGPDGKGVIKAIIDGPLENDSAQA